MQHTGHSLSIRFAAILSMTIALAGVAWSQCNNPSSPGVVICTPTNNSTVVYNNLVSVRSTPAQGTTITGMIIYDNNVNIFQDSIRSVDLHDGTIFDGEHHVVVNVWDSDGHLCQAKTNFFVTGFGYAPCPQPRSPGVAICNPPAGAIYDIGPEVDAAARGQSLIKNLGFYLNGKLVTTVSGSGAIIPVLLSGQNIINTVKVVASDSSGNRYSATKILNADYTYGQYGCFLPPWPPGINVISPQPDAYVGNTFNLNTQILSNPTPIASMKAYIRSSVVATSEWSVAASRNFSCARRHAHPNYSKLG